MSYRVTKKLLDELLAIYADSTGQRTGHYEVVPVDSPWDSATQEPSHGGEAAEPYRSPVVDTDTEYRTIPGGLVLDHNTYYGGYVIEQIAPNGRTWISTPHGGRRSPREMEAYLRGLIAGS